MRASFLKSLFCFAATLLSSIGAQDVEPIRESNDSSPIRVACLGDSITWGYGLQKRANDSYPAQLAVLLGNKWDVRNFGFNGATALKNGTKPYDRLPVHKEALAFKPHVVIIKLGTNDTNARSWPSHRDEFLADYLGLIEEFEKLDSHPRIFLCLPVPLFRDRGKDYDTDKILTEQVIPRIKEAGRRKHLPTIDLYAEFESHAAMLPDGVHPDASGAKLMAQKVHAALTSKPTKAKSSP